MCSDGGGTQRLHNRGLTMRRHFTEKFESDVHRVRSHPPYRVVTRAKLLGALPDVFAHPIGYVDRNEQAHVRPPVSGQQLRLGGARVEQASPSVSVEVERNPREAEARELSRDGALRRSDLRILHGVDFDPGFITVVAHSQISVDSNAAQERLSTVHL
jgi:hypothetical protein